MSLLRGTFTFLRNVLVAGEPDSGAAVAWEEPTDPGPAPKKEPEPKTGAEFDDLLESLDAVLPASDESRIFSLKDETIAELQRMLEQLRPVGEKLAETEKLRLAGIARIAQLETELEGEREIEHKATYQLRVQNALLRRDLEKCEHALEGKVTALARANERLAKLREKLEDRRRVAAERWNEIRELRASKKELERELAKAR